MEVQESVEKGFFNPNNEFTGKQGLKIAAAVTGIDDERESIIDPRIAELKFEYLGWNIKPDGGATVSNEIISSHPCTDEELGIGTESTMGFYPVAENSKTQLNFYKRKFLCPDTDELKIFGEANNNKV